MSHTIYAAKFEQTIIPIATTQPFSLPCKYLQGSENGRVVTIDDNSSTCTFTTEKSVTFTGGCANEIIPSINRSFVYKALLYNDFIVNIYIQLDWEQVFTTY